ncbi:MAG: chemotaxis protein CheW [Acidobacteria bacterium]|nr:chemotaxis protein CheW [Acidobacteriota bacterium]
MNGGGRLSTFSLGGLLFGVEALAVQEVIRTLPITPVPLAPAVVAGLANLRGQVVTAIDLARRLGLPPQPGAPPPSMHVVLKCEGGPVSLLVDEIGEVVEADAAAFEPPPATLVGPARELIRGAFKLEGRLLLVLDPLRTARVHDPVRVAKPGAEAPGCPGEVTG